MAKTQKIWLSLVLLVLVLFGQSRNVRTGNAPCNASLQYTPQQLNEYHRSFIVSDPAHKYAIPKVKIKTRFKGGEAPFISVEYTFPSRFATFTEAICTVVYRDRIPDIRPFAVSLRGPPSSMPS